MKKKHLWYSILFLAALLVLGWSNSASGLTLTKWQNFPPTALVDEDGIALPIGTGLIQLIYAGPDNTINDPLELLPTCAERQEWLSNYCPPVGDDVIKHSTLINTEQAGYFEEVDVSIPAPVPLPGEFIYTRFYTTRYVPEEPDFGDWYGNSPLFEVPDADEFYYIIDAVSPPLQADHQIVPEPSIFFLLGGGLILLLLKRRK